MGLILTGNLIFFPMRLLTNLLSYFAELPIKDLGKDQELGLLASLYENDAFRKYSQLREKYLIEACAERVLQDKIPDSKGYAGQIKEVREFRQRCQAAYVVIKKRQMEKSQEKKSVLADE